MENLKILIVEDNRKFIDSLSNYLKTLNIDILLATDGILALDMINKYRPNIVLLDLNLPKLNGINVLKRINNIDNSQINVIIISGERILINKIPTKSYEFIKGVFYKPVELNKIQYSIEHILIERVKNKDITKLKKLLENFDFNKNSKGYNYLVECMIELLNSPNKSINLEKTIYSIIAKRHKIEDINQIKWCISKTLKSMVRFTDKKILSEYFLYCTNITPKYFMRTIYDIIKSESYK